MTITKEEINGYKYTDLATTILLFLTIYNFDMISSIMLMVYTGLIIFGLIKNEDFIENIKRKDVFFSVTVFLILFQIIQSPISIIWMSMAIIFFMGTKYLFDEYGYPLELIKSKINNSNMVGSINEKKDVVKNKLEEKGITQKNIQKKMDVFNEKEK